jgi:hypothetical protein
MAPQNWEGGGTMGDGWIKFKDSHGINNSYPTKIKGLEFHSHGENFEGPASLKFGNETIETLSPGDALYRAGMIEFHKRFSDK